MSGDTLPQYAGIVDVTGLADAARFDVPQYIQSSRPIFFMDRIGVGEDGRQVKDRIRLEYQDGIFRYTGTYRFDETHDLYRMVA